MDAWLAGWLAGSLEGLLGLRKKCTVELLENIGTCLVLGIVHSLISCSNYVFLYRPHFDYSIHAMRIKNWCKIRQSAFEIYFKKSHIHSKEAAAAAAEGLLPDETKGRQ